MLFLFSLFGENKTMKTDITYFAKTNFRNEGKVFGIRQSDRLMHTYIIGKTGVGKSTLLKFMFLQDVQAGRGVCLLDPHGDLVESIREAILEAPVKLTT